jgi:hypothetical protein
MKAAGILHRSASTGFVELRSCFITEKGCVASVVII